MQRRRWKTGTAGPEHQVESYPVLEANHGGSRSSNQNQRGIPKTSWVIIMGYGLAAWPAELDGSRWKPLHKGGDWTGSR